MFMMITNNPFAFDDQHKNDFATYKNPSDEKENHRRIALYLVGRIDDY